MRSLAPSTPPPSHNSSPLTDDAIPEEEELSTSSSQRRPSLVMMDEEALRTLNSRLTAGNRRRRTPKETIIDFDGNVRTVRTHHVRGGVCTRGCMAYTVHVFVLTATAIVGMTMAIISGHGTPEFGYWISLFTLAVGGFLPNPRVKNKNATSPVFPAEHELVGGTETARAGSTAGSTE